MQSKNLKQIFLWPCLLGLLALAGLIVALLQDGLAEQLSLLGLVLPILVIVYFYFFKGSSSIY